MASSQSSREGEGAATASWCLRGGRIQELAAKPVLEGQGKRLGVGTLPSDCPLCLTAPDSVLDKEVVRKPSIA